MTAATATKRKKKLTDAQRARRNRYVRETEEGMRHMPVAVCVTHRDDEDFVIRQTTVNLLSRAARDDLWKLEYWALCNGHSVEKWALEEGESVERVLVDLDE